MLTTRPGGDVWSYPNIHGHIAATANAAGAKTGITVIYSPDGVALDPLWFSGSDPVPVDPPDNSAGSFDYGWQGKDQRPLEHAGTLLATIEMGARQYVPSIGRFIEIDPVEGASASDYDYCLGDPINCEDLNGELPSWKSVKKWGKSAWSKTTVMPNVCPVLGCVGIGVRNGRPAVLWGIGLAYSSPGVAIGWSGSGSRGCSKPSSRAFASGFIGEFGWQWNRSIRAGRSASGLTVSKLGKAASNWNLGAGYAWGGTCSL